MLVLVYGRHVESNNIDLAPHAVEFMFYSKKQQINPLSRFGATDELLWHKIFHHDSFYANILPTVFPEEPDVWHVTE